jgi:Zn-dependent peptidase ImmA (M78 family)
MMEALGQPYASDIPRANSQEDSETVARVLRESFGISIRQQLGWKTSGEAFRQWRDALESRRIPVFQADFPRRESQGFSVSDAHPYAIVVTSQDPFTARCFTLFHEFAHLLLREGGICLTEEAPSSDGDSLAKTEYWCHRFAEAFLVDADTLRDRRETGIILRRESGYEQALRRLASSFEVSQHVVLFRLWHLGLMSEARFWMEYGRVRQEAAAEAAQRQAKKKESKGGPSPAAHVVQERGRFFTRLVLEALEREMLSYAEAIGYLGVRLKHLDELRQTAYG